MRSNTAAAKCAARRSPPLSSLSISPCAAGVEWLRPRLSAASAKLAQASREGTDCAPEKGVQDVGDDGTRLA